MSEKDKRRALQLGMPYGTATGRLRKLIVFWLLDEFNKRTCFRCGSDITTANDLSIEHILPWENRDVALFWDRNNIAFSHIQCNKPHGVTRTVWKKIRKL